MKKILPLLVLTIACGISLHAQEFNRRNISVAMTWQGMDQESFFGPTVDFNIVRWKKSNWPTIGVGFNSGVLITKMNEQKPLFMPTEPVTFLPNYQIEGHVFLIPVENYFLVGFREDYIDFGISVQYAVFSGSSQYEYLNERYIYDKQSVAWIFAPHIGYRHQPKNSGAFFRILWKPTWNLDNDSYANCYQVSLGYSL